MFDKVNIVIALVAAIAVLIFGIIKGSSLTYLAVCLIITILAFLIIGFFVKRALIKWFEKDEEEEETEENSEEETGEDSESVS